jgi:hypothetical protein
MFRLRDNHINIALFDASELSLVSDVAPSSDLYNIRENGKHTIKRRRYSIVYEDYEVIPFGDQFSVLEQITVFLGPTYNNCVFIKNGKEIKSNYIFIPEGFFPDMEYSRLWEDLVNNRLGTLLLYI